MKSLTNTTGVPFFADRVLAVSASVHAQEQRSAARQAANERA
jgi:hypothetical protein